MVTMSKRTVPLPCLGSLKPDGVPMPSTSTNTNPLSVIRRATSATSSACTVAAIVPRVLQIGRSITGNDGIPFGVMELELLCLNSYLAWSAVSLRVPLAGNHVGGTSLGPWRALGSRGCSHVPSLGSGKVFWGVQ